MQRVAAFVLVASALFPTASIANALDEKELSVLLGWASHFSGRPLPAASERPATIALSAPALAQTVCPDDLDRCLKVLAAYDAERRRIVYLDTLDTSKPIDRSFLVHELVHYLQHLQRGEAFSNADCRAALDSEREAYRAQNKYLAHVGQRRRVGQALLFTHCDFSDTKSRAARDEPAPAAVR